MTFRCEVVLAEAGPFQDRQRVSIEVDAPSAYHVWDVAREEASETYDWPWSLVEVEAVEQV